MTQVAKTEYTNLYPLNVRKGGGAASSDEFHLRSGEFTKALRDSLAASGWYIDRFSFSRIVAHRKGAELPIPTAARSMVHFYPAYCIQVHEFYGRSYVSVDYVCQVLSVRKAHEVMRHIPAEGLLNRGCVAQTESWRTGRIVAADPEWVTVHFYDNEEERQVQADRVIPNLSLGQIEELLRQRADLVRPARHCEKAQPCVGACRRSSQGRENPGGGRQSGRRRLPRHLRRTRSPPSHAARGLIRVRAEVGDHVSGSKAGGARGRVSGSQCVARCSGGDHPLRLL